MADEVRRVLGRPVEILLVEDDQSDVASTKEAFRRAQIESSIRVAADGEEAMRMLRREEPHADLQRPDVILLDLSLPRKHGREVIDEISQDAAISEIPIVVLTGSDIRHGAAISPELRANPYLIKPVTAEGVEKIVALVGGAPCERAAHTPASIVDVENELSEFSYIVSHDLSASLRHIAAFSQLLMRDLGADATANQISYCDHIQDASQKCQLMMDALLAYSCAQQAPLTLKPCDGKRLMEVAMLQLSAEVKSAGAEISIEPLGTFIVDSALMTLAFQHVLSNAIKFCRQGVGIEVNVREVEKEGLWTVLVSDNGIGESCVATAATRALSQPTKAPVWRSACPCSRGRTADE